MHTTLPLPDEPDLLAAALRADTTDPAKAAAVEILVGLPGELHARVDIWRDFIGADDQGVYVNWSALAHAIRTHQVPLSSGERQMLLIACSLATIDVEISLGQAMAGMDAGNVELLTSALRRAAGQTDDPMLHEREPEATGVLPVPAGIEGLVFTGRRCRHCGAATGLVMLPGNPLTLTPDTWECAGDCLGGAA